MAWTTPPRTWVAGEKPSAATMNTHIRDEFKAIGDAWAAWTPAWSSAGTQPALGNGTLTGGVKSAGKDTSFWIELTIGSSSTLGTSNYLFTLPKPETAHRWKFEGTLFDTSTGDIYPIIGVRESSGLITMHRLPTTAGNPLMSFTGTVPVALGAGDVAFIHGAYEAA